MTPPRLQPVGDSALLVTYGDHIDLELNGQVMALARVLSENPLPGVGEAVPGFVTLLVHYDPLVLEYEMLESWLHGQLSSLALASPVEARLFEVPVIYGGEAGPDLAFVAEYNDLSESEVVRLHSARDYPVYMMGFTPGFPYLGGLDERIAAPRLESPRSRVPGGSVGIAGQQTGIYPLDSPGGWRIIGRTHLRLFDPQRAQACLLAPGDRVRFVPA